MIAEIEALTTVAVVNASESAILPSGGSEPEFTGPARATITNHDRKFRRARAHVPTPRPRLRVGAPAAILPAETC
jgi:hypothetical protein